MDIIIHGATGHMGQLVAQCAERGFAGARIAALVSPSSPEGGGENCYSALNACPDGDFIVVDFSNHATTTELLDCCIRRRWPVVIATTGQTAEETAAIHAAAEQIPVFHAANTSVGITVLADLAARAAAAFPDADIEIVETHHHRKLDVPSGTALLLARAIQKVRGTATLHIGRHENGRRTPQEIGVHSIRLGNTVGVHEILISTGSETLSLKHQAEDRTLFAEGALTAAAFLRGRDAGYYTMQDLLGN